MSENTERPTTHRSAEQDAHEGLATLAGGCFWCLEAVFDQLRGVLSVESGYMGGASDNPSYEEVCGGDSGHAEVVQIRFDPAQVSFRELLEVFFLIHDPTTRNRQGNDVGTQYRSAVFFHSPAQQQQAQQLMQELGQAGVWSRPIVTELVPAERFWPAEAYHQDYYARNPGQSYCMFVVEPKVAKFRKHYLDRLKG